MDPPKVSLRDSGAISDTMVMHIAANVSLNEPLMYVYSISYFSLTIFLSGLAFLFEWM